MSDVKILLLAALAYWVVVAIWIIGTDAMAGCIRIALWKIVKMVLIIVAILAAFLVSGCTVGNANMHVSLLCDKNIVQSDGMHVNAETLHHVRCDRRYPVRFTINLN